MASPALATLVAVLEVFRPAVTQPGYRRLLVVFVGWVRTTGRHAVTAALVATAIEGAVHHEAFHRFFSRGTWSPDRLGELLFRFASFLVGPDQPLHVVIDDTLATKKGPHVFGIGTHLDAVRSTKRFRVFQFGHIWVVVALLVRVPFSQRTWALPLLFRLYRNVRHCSAHDPYRKKTELAREMLDRLVSWVGERRINVSADAFYCNETLLRGLPPNVFFCGAMRPDAVLTALPAKRRGVGRPPIRGRVLAKPRARARDTRFPWQRCRATLYGHETTVRYKTYCGQWYRVYGVRLVRVVIVHVATGAIPFRVFFSTDPDLPVERILENYAGRWAIEVCFRDLKQLLGFGESSARKRAAVERVAPFVGYIYTALVLWFARGAHRFTKPLVRPWYRQRRGPSFADILRTAQGVLPNLDVLDPARSFANLREPTAPRAHHPARAQPSPS